MQSYRHSILALTLALGVAAPATAQPSAASDDSTVALAPSLERWRLDDGLRVVLDARPESTIVSVCSVWDVGWRDESDGELGYARIVEQLARRGEEVEPRVAQRGGSTWSRTDADRTSFCTTVPASELPLAVWAEASRLQPLRATPVLLERERDRAISRLLAVGSDAPRERGRELLFSLAFQGWWRAERAPDVSL